MAVHLALVPTSCTFCDLAHDRLVWSDECVVAIRDGYPVSPGHTLILPRRHVASWFDATPDEQRAILAAIAQVRHQLDRELRPDGYNIGINAGEAAGQTVMHLHLHIIPRFQGDVDDPRGGVRGVIPARQKYDPSAPPAGDDPFAALHAFVPGEERHLLPVLQQALRVALEVDIVAAFVQLSGFEVLEHDLIDALERGAAVRLLTGDYLRITHPHALQRLYTLATRYPNLGARLYRVADDQAFHPKAYIFVRGRHGVAFIGSSNLSRSALTRGVEWNLRTTHADASTFRDIRGRFDALFTAPQAAPLTKELVDEYQRTVRVPPAPEPATPRPQPHAVQQEVLRALAQTREHGHRRGLVVLATGLGKTYLAAFDLLLQGGRRALFVAHVDEILQQAASAWARVLPDRSIGFLTGKDKRPDADLLFASVQTLTRAEHLRSFAPDHFHYIVVDEFHHAAAATYRKLLAHFSPAFLLGLTATPDRTDGAALLELCDDNLVARVGLVEGIARGLLVPFHYYGIRDGIDFSVIPWSRGRFDEAALTAAAATRDHAAQALRELRRHAPGRHRTLVFCASKGHADFIAAYFREQGVAAAAVHSGATTAPRAASLEKFRRGELEVIVAVDIFNEGVDLPDVDAILMLRPTESPIVFLQQLGRGLRVAAGKTSLCVVDFIGNHRSFLAKPQALLALTGHDVAPGDALRRLRVGDLELPPGCSIEIETDALDLLERVARLSPDDALKHAYRLLRDTHGRRPTARELLGAGVTMRPVVQRYGTWFHFVADMDDLTGDEQRVLADHRSWFTDLSGTRMQRSYKMIALQVMDDLDVLHTEIEVRTLAERCRERIRRDPRLRVELAEHESAGGELDDFVARWREMPLRVFHAAKEFSRQWFALEGSRFVSRLTVDPADRATFDEMTAELVELRLAEFLQRNQTYADNVVPFVAPIELTVSHSSGNPILRFDRGRRPDIPEDDAIVEVDGVPVTFHFVKIAVNKASERPGGPNVLPERMRRWFGPTAGQPGTRHRVFLTRTASGWTLRQSASTEVPAPVISLGRIPYFPELAVACGVAAGQVVGHDVQTRIAVEASRALEPQRHFVVRAAGDSMDGGDAPIRDGDLVLCEWATASDPREVEGKAVLLTGGSGDDVLTSIKIPARKAGRWWLRSTNRTHPDRAVDPAITLRVVARVLEVVRERTDLVLWGLYDRDAIAAMFGQVNNPSWRSGHRDVELHGEPHTILMVNLHKGDEVRAEHRYADRFLAAEEFQWESQATTTCASAKGQRILHHAREGRRLHLFVRYHARDADGKGEPYVYCGTVQTLRHAGEAPIRVWFRLDHPLPHALWQVWST